jgi:glycosyltransferase involved in cell wall biosynthesis
MFMPDELTLRFGNATNIEYYKAKRRALTELTGNTLRAEKADVLVRSYPTPELPDFPVERQIVVIPDMQHAERPQFFSQRVLRQRRLAFGYHLANAGAIGTMTEFSRHSVLANPWTRCEVFLMPPGMRFSEAPRSEAAPTDEVAKIVAGFSGYFFMPANPWPHKNHRRLFDAFSRALPRLPAKTGLVLTGSGDAWGDLLKGFEGLPIVRLGYVAQEDLPFLYRHALALTFFSSYEGFGIPLLEAFHFGAPVLCSNIPALVEVGGDAVLTAAPDDTAGMADLMVEAATKPELRRTLIDKGRARLPSYSFHDSAGAFREAAERIVQRSKNNRSAAPGDNRPLISVLLDLATPAPDAGETFRALQSQTYDRFEVIPFGGPLPRHVAGTARVTSEHSAARASARAAMAGAAGDVLLSIRADCRLETTALERIVKELAAYPESDLVAIPSLLDRGNGRVVPAWSPQAVGPGRSAKSPIALSQSFERRILHDAVGDFRVRRPVLAWRRRIADLAGTFDDGVSRAYDTDYYVRMFEAGGALSILAEPMLTIALSADADSARYWSQAMKDLQTIVMRRGGHLGSRFFRLYSHRRWGVEPTLSTKWRPLAQVHAWTESGFWLARRIATRMWRSARRSDTPASL